MGNRTKTQISKEYTRYTDKYTKAMEEYDNQEDKIKYRTTINNIMEGKEDYTKNTQQDQHQSENQGKMTRYQRKLIQKVKKTSHTTKKITENISTEDIKRELELMG